MADATEENNDGVTKAQAITDTDTESSRREALKQLIAKATALSGIKDYTAAAGVYSDATEIQAELNGEMNVDNADLLYAYGRCLFFVAQKTSTVLGGTAAGAQLSHSSEKKVPKKRTPDGKQQKASERLNGGLPDVSETSTPADVIPASSTKTEESTESKPLFQFTGDDNYDESEDEENEDGEEEEDDDDFENSFELLDLARVLFYRKLDSLQKSEESTTDKGKETSRGDMSTTERDIKTRIADIYDLQAEISLEGEKFAAAVSDLKSCLELKEELEKPESSLLAECHYKLSLALEVAAQEQARDADGNPVGDITINWDVRNEAVAHQEKAIESCELRVTKEKEKSQDMSEGESKRKATEQIEDVQEMITEMKDRLNELRKPPINVKAETENDLNKDIMAGVLGQIMGATGKSKEEQKEELAKVIAGATDLSGMVKKRKPKSASANDETASNASGTGSKRKVEFLDEGEEINGKKAKVEDVEDSGI